MIANSEYVEISGLGGGATYTIPVHRFGCAGARPKVYIQGGLHADEGPGMRAALSLLERLQRLDTQNRVLGEIILVPAANPIGLNQRLLGGPIGRFDLATGGNYNRGYPDLSTMIAPRLEDRLGPDAARNVEAIRAELLAAVEEWSPNGAADTLRKTLMGLCVDADILLDLHCDSVAPVHIYMGTPLWPDAVDLAACLKAELVFLAEVSGGEPFDEAASSPWWLVPKILGLDPDRVPIPPACLAATVELRGSEDVTSVLGDQDAEGILRFLTLRGVLAGAEDTPDFTGLVAPLAGVEMIRSIGPGLFEPLVAIGADVEAGTPVARIVDPTDLSPKEQIISASAAGRVWSLSRERIVPSGAVLVKTATDRPLDGKGDLLLTA